MAVMVNGATKKGQALLVTAANWQGTELWDVYGTVSQAKRNAMEQCKAWCAETNGYDFHICGHSCHQFTVAWNYMNPETGEVMTRIETAQNTYIVDGSR